MYAQEEPSGAPFIPETNFPLKQKLSRWFGILAAAGFAVVFAGIRFPDMVNLTLTAGGLPLGVWSISMYAMLQEPARYDKPAHDFAFMWGKRPAFRRMNIFLGFLMATVFDMLVYIAPPPPNQRFYVIAMFASLVAILFVNIFYVSSALKKGVRQPVDNWTSAQQRLENVFYAGSFISWFFGYFVISAFLPDLIHELFFALLFSAAGLLVGYVVHDQLKSWDPDFFNGEERQRQLLVCVYVTCLILTLCASAVVNYRTAGRATRPERYRVLDKSEVAAGHRARYLWLEIGGQKKRFEPRWSEWQNIRTGDTLDVLTGKGVLGFDVILKYGGIQKDSL